MHGDIHRLTGDELLEHAGFLKGLAGELVGTERAQDLLQDAWVAALERGPRERRSLRAWLAIVVANLARNARRGTERRTRREQRAASHEREEPAELALERLEVQHALSRLVLELPEEQRTVLYLRYYEGCSPSAIATRLGLPVKTVKSRHTRALAALRQRLDARSGGDRRVWLSALAPLTAPRGAGSGGVAAAGATAVLGGLAVKKAVLVAVLAGLALLSWWGWERGEPRRSGASGRDYVNLEALEEKPAELAPALAPEALATRRPIAEAPPVTTGALEVHLAWPDGSPAEGVGIDAACAEDPAPRTEYFRAVTDARGVALFAQLFAGSVRLHPDLRASFEAVVEAGTTRTVTLILAAGFDVAGQVVAPDGRPVGHAEIWCKGPYYECPDLRPVLRCADDGTFRLRAIDGDALFGARAPGFGPSPSFRAESLPVARDGARGARLELGASGCRVTGLVLDPDGRPLAGARVLAGPRGRFNLDLPSGLRGWSPDPAPIETGPDGTFALANDLEPGRQPIWATARGFPVWQGELELAAGQASFVEIRLEKPARIEGRVVGVEGAPLSGVRVLAAEEDRGGWYWHPFPPSEDVSDEQGWFALDWVAPGLRELNAHDREHPELGRARASVRCAVGETATCELRLELGLTIAGRVEDQGGRALAGWNVYDERSWTHPRQAKTDAQGRFLLANLGAGPHDLTVSAPGEAPIPPRAQQERVQTGTTELVLVVRDAGVEKGTYRGFFLGSDGRPPQDVELVVYPEGGSSGLFVSFDPTSGAFEDQALPGPYRLSAQRGGTTLARSNAFEIAEGGDTDVGVMRIGEPGALELRVRGLDSGELARIEPVLDRDGHGTTALVLEDGVFRAGDLAPGLWTLTTHDERWYLTGSIEIASGGTTALELDALPTLELRVSIRDERPGTLLGKVSLEAWRPDGTLLYRSARRHVEARATLEWSLFLPAGPVELEARDGERHGRGALTLDEGGASLAITLR